MCFFNRTPSHQESTLPFNQCFNVRLCNHALHVEKCVGSTFLDFNPRRGSKGQKSAEVRNAMGGCPTWAALASQLNLHGSSPFYKPFLFHLSWNYSLNSPHIFPSNSSSPLPNAPFPSDSWSDVCLGTLRQITELETSRVHISRYPYHIPILTLSYSYHTPIISISYTYHITIIFLSYISPVCLLDSASCASFSSDSSPSLSLWPWSGLKRAACVACLGMTVADRSPGDMEDISRYPYHIPVIHILHPVFWIHL